MSDNQQQQHHQSPDSPSSTSPPSTPSSNPQIPPTLGDLLPLSPQSTFSTPPFVAPTYSLTIHQSNFYILSRITRYYFDERYWDYFTRYFYLRGTRASIKSVCFTLYNIHRENLYFTKNVYTLNINTWLNSVASPRLRLPSPTALEFSNFENNLNNQNSNNNNIITNWITFGRDFEEVSELYSRVTKLTIDLATIEWDTLLPSLDSLASIMTKGQMKLSHLLIRYSNLEDGTRPVTQQMGILRVLDEVINDLTHFEFIYYQAAPTPQPSFADQDEFDNRSNNTQSSIHSNQSNQSNQSNNNNQNQNQNEDDPFIRPEIRVSTNTNSQSQSSGITTTASVHSGGSQITSSFDQSLVIGPPSNLARGSSSFFGSHSSQGGPSSQITDSQLISINQLSHAGEGHGGNGGGSSQGGNSQTSSSTTSSISANRDNSAIHALLGRIQTSLVSAHVVNFPYDYEIAFERLIGLFPPALRSLGIEKITGELNFNVLLPLTNLSRISFLSSTNESLMENLPATLLTLNVTDIKLTPIVISNLQTLQQVIENTRVTRWNLSIRDPLLPEFGNIPLVQLVQYLKLSTYIDVITDEQATYSCRSVHYNFQPMNNLVDLTLTIPRPFVGRLLDIDIDGNGIRLPPSIKTLKIIVDNRGGYDQQHIQSEVPMPTELKTSYDPANEHYVPFPEAYQESWFNILMGFINHRSLEKLTFCMPFSSVTAIIHFQQFVGNVMANTLPNINGYIPRYLIYHGPRGSHPNNVGMIEYVFKIIIDRR